MPKSAQQAPVLAGLYKENDVQSDNCYYYILKLDSAARPADLSSLLFVWLSSRQTRIQFH